MQNKYIFSSPHDSRQFTPVQSDSELETKRGASISEGDESKKGEEPLQQSWRWGELPTSTHEETKQQEGKFVIIEMFSMTNTLTKYNVFDHLYLS